MEGGTLRSPHSNQSHTHPLPPRENPDTADWLARCFPMPISARVYSDGQDMLSAAPNCCCASVFLHRFLHTMSNGKVDLIVDFAADEPVQIRPKH